MCFENGDERKQKGREGNVGSGEWGMGNEKRFPCPHSPLPTPYSPLPFCLFCPSCFFCCRSSHPDSVRHIVTASITLANLERRICRAGSLRGMSSGDRGKLRAHGDGADIRRRAIRERFSRNEARRFSPRRFGRILYRLRARWRAVRTTTSGWVRRGHDQRLRGQD